MAKLSRPIRWPGGKYYQAASFVAVMPPHDSFVDTHAGALNVLLEKPQIGVAERVCDINRELTNFWRVLRSKKAFDEFQRIVAMTPLSELEFDKASKAKYKLTSDAVNVEAAVSFFIRIRMSRLGAGKSYLIPTSRLRRGINEQVSAWLGAVDGLLEVHQRLQSVEVICGDATEVVPTFDGKTTLFYADPPYMHGTRVTKTEYGENEMSDRSHARLLAVFSRSNSPLLSEAEWDALSGTESYTTYVTASRHRFKGMLMLSGYESDLYARYTEANKWTVLKRRISNSSSSQAVKPVKTECLWVNFPVDEAKWLKSVKGQGEVSYAVGNKTKSGVES